jgi:DNA ligase-1
MKTTLYQLDTNNNTKVWSIEVYNKETYSEITILSGRLNGKMMENTSKVLSGKNEGKTNETTHYTQAVSEMNSKIESQLRKGYVRDLKDAKNSSVLGSGLPAPMLAHKFCADGSQASSKTLKQLNLVGKEVIVQPKLDGNRCLIKIENGDAQMFTRKGDLMPVQLNHILNDLLGYSYNCILDGELFSNEISFNTLNGLIKREKATSEDVEKRKNIKFNLYDVMFDQGYEERNKFIQQFASGNILIVPSKKIVATDENIQTNLEVFLAEGHEGLMIRQLGIGYENKRTWQLLKVKVFEDSEFQLIGFEEDVRCGFVGAFVLRDNQGRNFNAGASGQSVEERKFMWLNQDKYIGQTATVEYFGLSEYGVPRFPKFKGIRS